MSRLLALVFLLAASRFAGWAPAVQAEEPPVDLAIVLAVDSSGSINTERYFMQLRGYAGALTSPEILNEILSGRHHRIAVTYFEWADAKRVARVVPWTVIDGKESAAKVADLLAAHRRQLVGDTCIGCAIEEAMKLFAELPYKPDRKVLDISGDGESNAGPPVGEPRALALSQDITINGLPIVTAYEPNLAHYYQSEVIGGPGAFVIAARGFDDFTRAIGAKLLREIADRGTAPSQLAEIRRGPK
ncbi:MAG: DUF1194 domain-containing protein [Proteobacteria bacterium]|nr:DUF1194 domain-containing protein [Pseudomonadota bacterium]MBI3498053.1 DUF1194 domain-containing protein [Pseudomonadota bacterium]